MPQSSWILFPVCSCSSHYYLILPVSARSPHPPRHWRLPHPQSSWAQNRGTLAVFGQGSPVCVPGSGAHSQAESANSRGVVWEVLHSMQALLGPQCPPTCDLTTLIDWSPTLQRHHIQCMNGPHYIPQARTKLSQIWQFGSCSCFEACLRSRCQTLLPLDCLPTSGSLCSNWQRLPGGCLDHWVALMLPAAVGQSMHGGYVKHQLGQQTPHGTYQACQIRG